MAKNVKDIALVTIALMGILVTVLVFRMELRLASMKLLRYQLQSLRTSVSLFRVIEDRNPRSIKDLVDGQYSWPGEDRSHYYVDHSMVEQDGSILDPFGHPYALDSKTGWVRSTTKGFEYW